MTAGQSEASRLGPTFDSCRNDNRAALIGYLPTGYPDVPTSVAAMIALVESGCDIIEVGVPYSDPGMDGPTIARATEAALRGGVRVRDSLAAVEAISDVGGCAVVMTYWNPVLRYGLDPLAKAAAARVIDGCLLTDVSVEEAEPYIAVMRRAGLDTVFLGAPTSSREAPTVAAISTMVSAAESLTA